MIKITRWQPSFRMNFHLHSPLQSNLMCLRNRTDTQSPFLWPPQNHCWCSCHQTTGPRPCWVSGGWMSSPPCTPPGQTTCTQNMLTFTFRLSLVLTISHCNASTWWDLYTQTGSFSLWRVFRLCESQEGKPRLPAPQLPERLWIGKNNVIWVFHLVKENIFGFGAIFMGHRDWVQLD